MLQIEERVVQDIQGIINQLVDREGFTKMVNAELRQMWEAESGYNPDAEKHIKALDTKIQDVYKALEDGFQDAAWANSRLKELHAERDKLSASQTKQTKPLQVDADRAIRFREDLQRVLSDDNLAERKKYVQNFIDSASLNPETRKLHIRYSVPSSVVNNDVTEFRASSEGEMRDRNPALRRLGMRMRSFAISVKMRDGPPRRTRSGV